MTEGPDGGGGGREGGRRASEGPRWRRATERKNIPHFSVNIHSRNKVDIGIRATDGALKLSSPSPASSLLPRQQPHLPAAVVAAAAAPARSTHPPRCPFSDTDQHPGAFTPSSHRASTTSTANRRADVSTCRPITDCRGVEKVAEAFHSVAFLLETRALSSPSPRRFSLWSSAPLQAATAISILLPCTRRSCRPPVPRPLFVPLRNRYHPDSLSLSLSLSLFLDCRSPTAPTERGVYKFARRNCREKYGILSAKLPSPSPQEEGELAGVSSGGSWRGYRKNRSEVSSQVAVPLPRVPPSLSRCIWQGSDTERLSESGNP